ncbi:MAG: sensor histidine kinase [Culicoidibacterales bacterium]
MAIKLKEILRKRIVKNILLMAIVCLNVYGGLKMITIIGPTVGVYNSFSKEEVRLQENSNKIMEDLEKEAKTGQKSVNLATSTDFIYYGSYDGRIFANTEKRLEESFRVTNQGYYCIFKAEMVDCLRMDPSSHLFGSSISLAEKDFLYFSYTEAYIEKLGIMVPKIDEQNLIKQVIEVSLSVLIGIGLCLGLLIIGTGRKEGGQVEQYRSDKLYTEIQVGALPLMIIYVVRNLVVNTTDYWGEVPNNLLLLGFGLLLMVGTSVCLWLLLSLIRKAKQRVLLKHSFLFLLVRGGERILCLRKGRVYSKAERLFSGTVIFLVEETILLLLILFVFDLSEISVLLVICGLFILVVYLHWSYKQVAEIDDELDQRLAEQVKAQKMKFDLITNISHDLKTPLTAIISYTELLAGENLNQKATEYTTILSQKANLLNYIVSDLFDLAKATSGNLELTTEVVEFKKLVEQTLVEMEQTISAKNLKISKKMPAYSLEVICDGGKMYRVIQNIIENALKYGQENTRVFIELSDVDDKYYRLIVKNTANYEMNFSPTEIVQRFTRGDESRTSEGSGLGLSIAKEFTEANGGIFEVIIDGDQFKVIVSLPQKEQ